MLLPVRLRTPGQAKPYGSIPKINWAHPLARGLCIYAYDCGNVIIDLVAGAQSKLLTAMPPAGSSKYGSGFNYPGGVVVQQVQLPINKRFTSAIAPYSFACALLSTAAPGGSAATPFGTGDSSGNTPFDVITVGTGSATDVIMEYGNGAGDTMTGVNTLNVFHTFLGVATGAAASIDYADGKQVTTGTANTNWTQTTAFPLFNAFETIGTTSSGCGFQGFIYYGAAWNRALSATEALQLHLDPYCFLIYPEDEMFAEWVGAAAAAIFDTIGSPIFRVSRQPWTWR